MAHLDSFVIPVGVDWADGATVLRVQPNGAGGAPSIVGTPLPTAMVEMYYSGAWADTIQEESGSPEIERAEQCTCRHSLKLPYQTGLAYWTVMGRGTMVTDTAANVWRGLSCNIKRLNEPCKIGTSMDVFCEFSYVMESISFDTPPDGFDVQEMSLDLDIIKHPRYAWALNPYVTDASTYVTVGTTKIYYQEVKEAIIRMIQNYIESPFYPSMNQTNSLIQVNILNALTSGSFQIHWPNPNFVAPANGTAKIDDAVAWDGHSAYPATNCPYFLLTLTPANLALGNSRDPISVALAAAKELISKLWRKEDTPYIAGYKVIWTQKVFSTVYLNCGGYIEDPQFR